MPLDPNQGMLAPQAAAPAAAPMNPQAQPTPAGPGQPIQAGQGQPPEVAATRPPERNYKHNPLNDDDKGNLNKYIAMSTRVIHNPQTRDKILGRIQGKAHPYDEISDASLVVINRMEQEAVKEGEPWDQAIKLMGGTNVVEQVVELAGAAGKIQKNLAEKDIRLILGSTVQKYYQQKIAKGEITEAEASRDAYIAAQTDAKMQGEDTTKVSQQLEATQGVQDQANKMSVAPQQVQGQGGLQAPEPAADPFNPTTTMKNALATGQGGLLDA